MSGDELSRLSPAAIIADETTMRALLYESLANHPDPLLAEMGKQLRDGAIDLLGLRDVPVYAEAIRAALRQVSHADLARSIAELSKLADLRDE